MTPVLTVMSTSTRDAVELECDHSTTTLAGPSCTGEQTVALISAAMVRHGLDCACQPVEVVWVWPSMSEALAVFSEDASGARPAWASAMGDAYHAALIDTMQSRRCTDCDPEIVMRHRGDVVEVRVHHDRRCSTFARRGADRRMRIIGDGGAVS